MAAVARVGTRSYPVGRGCPDVRQPSTDISPGAVRQHSDGGGARQRWCARHPSTPEPAIAPGPAEAPAAGHGLKLLDITDAMYGGQCERPARVESSCRADVHYVG